jgi:uncharacterized protein (DUF433 family)
MMEQELNLTKKQSKDIRFDVPLYTLAEAARALGVPPSTFATWARGYKRSSGSRRSWHGDPIVTSLGGPARQPSIPFIGLAEGMVLAAVRRAGVPLQRVRPALAALTAEIGVDHALASKRLYTDGAELLFDYAEEVASVDAEVVRDLVVIRSRQRVFADVIEQYLKLISYGPDEYASKIQLPAYEYAVVVVDPKRSFGQPIFERSAVPVSNVLERFWAGEDIDTVSAEFGVPRPEIEDVLRATSRRAA